MIGFGETPVGWVRVDIRGAFIRSLNFVNDKPINCIRRNTPRILINADSTSSGISSMTYLKHYGTPLQRKIWSILTNIPKGEKSTYGEVADQIGGPVMARVVGNACGANRVAFIIPCHRVVAKGGIGGYRWGTKKKKSLLSWETQKPNDSFILSFWEFKGVC